MKSAAADIGAELYALKCNVIKILHKIERRFLKWVRSNIVGGKSKKDANAKWTTNF